MESLAEVIDWGNQRGWIGIKKERLKYLVAIQAAQATYSTKLEHGPDDTSPFGKPVYLRDMNVIELREYLLSGLSKVEQDRIFSE